MGGGNSKQAFLQYEEALRRVTESELKRLKDAFKRTSGVNGYMTKNTFIKEAFGDGIPARLAEQIFLTFGGSGKGIGFKELICGLVLITRGKQEEKYKFIFGLYAEENLNYVQKSDMDAVVLSTDGQVPAALSELFRECDKVNYEQFRQWLVRHSECTSISRWLLLEPCPVTLSNDHETPTFYQTLAGVTHLEENDIIELEKRYWILKSHSTSGKFDLDTFRGIVCPPIPKSIVESLFLAFDENRDNHIDFKEMACGISACCRGPLTERQKFCFKIFDTDRDGLLDQKELQEMIATMMVVRAENKSEEEMDEDGLDHVTPEDLASEILATHDANNDGKITPAEYLVWTVKHSLPTDFLDLLFQVCHVALGLRPQNKEDEGKVIIGWLERQERKGFEVGQTWYLVAISWWSQWLEYVNYQVTTPNRELCNNNVRSHDHYTKKSHSSLGTTFCPSLGRKYSTDSIGNEVGEVIGVTYSTLQYKDQKRLQNTNSHNGGGTTSSTNSTSVTCSSHSVTSSPTKYATLPRTSMSVQNSPIRVNHSSDTVLYKHGLGNQTTSLSIPPSTAIPNSTSNSLNPSNHGNRLQTTPSTSPRPSRKVYPTVGQKPGQVDNTSLVIPNTSRLVTLTNEGGRLKKDRVLTRGRDFELVPDAVWKALSMWYGGSPALPRTVIQSKHCTEPDLELYPIHVKLLRHQNPPQRPQQSMAFTGMMGGLGGMVTGSSGLSGGNNQPPIPRRYLAYTSCFSRKHTIGQIYDFLSTRLRITKDDIRLWMFKDEQNMSLLEEDSGTVEGVCIKEESQILIEVRNKDLTWPEELSLLAKNKAVLDKGPTITGVTGLSNLGNTCFMNSAVQCVSNTRPLTMYFKGGMHLYELNRNNPLGMKGHVAQRYGDLVKELWSGQTRSLAPLKLRWTIAKYAPRFSGFQQHDCQELLAFLLDGLHEDLNRVHIKPYVELKDSDGRLDTIVAKEAWENHMQRNKSIIVDLFHGQLKSEVRCRECRFDSVRFDPFTYLSLPLPMESCLHVEIIVMRLSGSTPVKYGLRMNMDDKYREIKREICSLSGIPLTQLLLVEIFGALIKSFPHDTQKIKPTVVSNLYVYEVPAITAIPIMTAAEERAEKQPGARETALVNSQDRGETPIDVLPAPNETDTENCAKIPATVTSEITLTPENFLKKSTGQKSPVIVNGSIPSHARSDSLSPTIPASHTVAHKNSDVNNSTSMFNQNAVVAVNQNVSTNQKNASYVNQNGLANGTAGSPNHQRNHSNGSSTNSTATSAASLTGLEMPYGLVVGLHRKMMRMDAYFLSSQKTRPSLFGTPLILPCEDDAKNQDLYKSVWQQVGRLVSPIPTNEGCGSQNHATDCDDSMGYEYPFLLKVVQEDGLQCAKCPWYRFCRGCLLECNTENFSHASTHIAIDWEPTALHLRYQSSQERVTEEHSSVGESRKKQTEPISLDTCLEAFTREEQLGEEELWFCSKCKKHQLADKKLQIWRLPPVLIIHLKRFQLLNGRWVKSQKIVKFPYQDVDLGNYLVSRLNTDQSESPTKLASANESTNHNTDDLNQKDVTHGAKGATNQKPNGTAEPVKDSSLEDRGTEAADVAMEISEDTDLSENMTETCSHNGEVVPRGPSVERSPLHEGHNQSFELEDYTDVRYDLYAMACHSGILGGGHYVTYGKNPNNKWYCYNDSMCKEINQDQIDTKSAYILFYERKDLNEGKFMPDVRGKDPDTADIDDECDSEIKRMCTIQ